MSDHQGPCIAITCGSISGHLFLSKFDESKKAQGKCVLVGGKWYTPPEVESLAGKKAKKWRQSLLHLGRPLSEYNLSPLDAHCLQHTPVTPVTPGTRASCSEQHQPHSASTPASTCRTTTTMVNVGTNCTSVVDPVLAFIKAYRLKGDTDSLRRVVKDHFSSAHVENAKRLLWDSCGQLLEEVNLPFYARRDSENRSQLSANIEDLVAAFDALDSKDMLPEMFCEASDFFRLPPLSLDPVAEQVNLNSRSLDMLTTSVKDLECKLSSLFSSISSAGDKANDPSTATSATYAARAAYFLPPSTSPMKPTGRSTGSSTSKFDDRVLNLILFGLPESRSIIDLKKTVDEIFEFLAEKPVQIKDLFRLGKRNPSPSPGARPRPVLIKVCATWDRRVLLLRKMNLQQFRLKGLFLRADVPPEHRLRQGTHVRAKSQPAAHQPSVSLAPETNAGNTSPVDSCPIQTSASPSTQSSSVTITNSSACLDSRDSGRNCRSSSPESVSHCSSSTSTLVQGYTSS